MKKATILFFSFLSVLLLTGKTFAQLPVVMNEIYSRGVTGNPDWIEVFNPNATSVDISGYKIYDIGGQGGTKPKKAFPNNTILAGNGVYVIVVDDTASSGFGLSSSGEKVWLENAAGTIIDTVTFPAYTVYQSYARYPDGAAWKTVNIITRGTSNSVVLMNEIYAMGTSSAPDWIELYNVSDTAKDLSGYKIYDAGGQSGSKPKKEIPAATVVPSKGFFVIVTDDGTASAFGLSSSGETVWFEDAAGVIIDTVKFLAHTNVQSYSRVPDGSPNWTVANTITRGASNIPVGIRDDGFNASTFSLNQNYPNPFNPSTLISFKLQSACRVSLKVYNILGNQVALLYAGDKPAGSYTVSWDASKYPSGIYYYALEAGNYKETRKMVLLK